MRARVVTCSRPCLQELRSVNAWPSQHASEWRTCSTVRTGPQGLYKIGEPYKRGTQEYQTNSSIQKTIRGWMNWHIYIYVVAPPWGIGGRETTWEYVPRGTLGFGQTPPHTDTGLWKSLWAPRSSHFSWKLKLYYLPLSVFYKMCMPSLAHEI